jgi:hypothetical protein
MLHDLAVVSCHFNPCHYRSRERNLFTYIDSMRRQGVPLFFAELSFNHGDFAVPSNDYVHRFRGDDVMWHKERLLNLVISRLPAQYTKVAWIDADAIFPDDRWYGWASGLLDAFDLIQLFDRLDQRDNDGQSIRELSGLAAYVAGGGPLPFKFDTSRTWPGLGWAAKRELLTAHGLLDRLILGGADTYMSLAAFNWGDTWSGWHIHLLTPRLRQLWTAWATPFFSDVQGRVGYVPTTAIQLGHGASSNRRYVDRMDVLTTYDYDPDTDIAPGADGVWQWSSSKAALHSEVLAYFGNRREDLSEIRAAADVAR